MAEEQALDIRAVQEILGNQFGWSLMEVLRTMTGFDPVPASRGAMSRDETGGRITGMILLTGSVNLLCALTMSADTLATLVSYMTGMAVRELSETDLRDGLLELANMTTGRTKTALADLGYRFQISAPFGIQGGDHTIFSKDRVPQVEKGYRIETMEIMLRIFKI